MNTGTSEEVEAAFRAELQALLDKYEGELRAMDHYLGYPGLSEDIRITVEIPALWNDKHICIREYVEIDLGTGLLPTSKG